MFLLIPGGKVMIFHQTEEGGYELYNRMLEQATLARRPINDHALSSKELSEMLTQNGVRHEVRVGPSRLNVDDFIQRHNDPIASHVVTFLLQTEYSNLTPELQQDIYTYVRERTRKDPDTRKHMFLHPTAMILIHSD